jgi:predicted peptidase
MKTKFNLLLIVSLAVLIPMKSKAQSKDDHVSAYTFQWKDTVSGELKYLSYLPKDYDAKGKKTWPLMLFLHGAGERGSDVQRVAIHGPISMVKQGKDFPFIIVAPQCPDRKMWDNESLLKLLDHAIEKYAVDTNRIYLTGLSMGGYGTWKLGLSYPEKFAAIVPICGGCNMIEVILGPRDKADAFKSLPVWAFHGAKDDVVPLSESERVVDALKKYGVKEVKFTVYPEAKHNSWTEAYKNPELYEWMLKHSRQ